MRTPGLSLHSDHSHVSYRGNVIRSTGMNNLLPFSHSYGKERKEKISTRYLPDGIYEY